jgi:hypothetical protein
MIAIKGCRTKRNRPGPDNLLGMSSMKALEKRYMPPLSKASRKEPGADATSTMTVTLARRNVTRLAISH